MESKKKNDPKEFIYKTEIRLTYIENKLTETKGESGEEQNKNLRLRYTHYYK